MLRYAVDQYRPLVLSVSVSLTKPTNRRETRQDDDPVIPGSEQPAAVYQDKFTEKFVTEIRMSAPTRTLVSSANPRIPIVACEVISRLRNFDAA